jgi:hypothetical protein
MAKSVPVHDFLHLTQFGIVSVVLIFGHVHDLFMWSESKKHNEDFWNGAELALLFYHDCDENRLL